MIHSVRIPGAWDYELHRHAGHCELVYLSGGTLTQVINGVSCNQVPGEVVLIRDTDRHSLQGYDMKYVNIMFPSDWIRRIESFVQTRNLADNLMLAADSPRALIPRPDREAFESSISSLLENTAGQAGRHAFAGFLVNAVTGHLAPARSEQIPSDLPEWLLNTVEWIHRQRRRPPALSEIVRYSSRCQEHFTRTFSHYFGMPPTAYLANLRVDRAAELLVTTNATVEEVCYECGFESPSYFFRLFKRRKNMSPRTYRRSYGPRSVQVR